ncbi:MAG: hypothetical protein ACK5CE_02220 [Actinomycetes bacterium]
MSANAQSREKAKPLPVGPPLASQMRAGAHMRRQLRSEQKAWLARNWRIVAVTFTLGTVGAIAAQALLPAQFAPFLIGAIAASCGWWVYTLMLELGGLANLRSGLTAEEWTAIELLGLHSKGWRTANHVMIEYGDVDHAALGPGGFFAIEPKFRSNWAQAELPYIARSAVDVRRRGRGRDLSPVEHDAIRVDSLHTAHPDHLGDPTELVELGRGHRGAAVHRGLHGGVEPQQQSGTLQPVEQVVDRRRLIPYGGSGVKRFVA